MKRTSLIVSGLPGVGKSTLAEGLSKELSWPVFSVDPIEAAMMRSGIKKAFATGLAAYEVVATLAEEHLKLDQSVIIDAVSPVKLARQRWQEIAKNLQANLIIIEVTCSDETVYRQRIETRVRNIKGFDELTWEHAKAWGREYEPWTDDRLIVDSLKPESDNLAAALAYVQKSAH